MKKHLILFLTFGFLIHPVLHLTLQLIGLFLLKLSFGKWLLFSLLSVVLYALCITHKEAGIQLLNSKQTREDVLIYKYWQILGSLSIIISVIVTFYIYIKL